MKESEECHSCVGDWQQGKDPNADIGASRITDLLTKKSLQAGTDKQAGSGPGKGSGDRSL